MSKRGTYDAIFSGVAVAIGLVASLVTIEVACRTIIDDGMNFDLEMWKYAREIKRVSSIEGLGHEHSPNTFGVYMGVPVTINSFGFRDREYSLEKPQDTLRILMLGDSVTFGWGVKLQDTVAKKLEKRLDKSANYIVEVINGGVGNYNTVMEVRKFMAKGQKLNPDILVLNYFINDAEPAPHKRELFLLDYSRALAFVFGRIDSLQRMYFGKEDWKEYYSQLYDNNSKSWLAVKSAIWELYQHCRERDIRLLIANYPELHELDPYPFRDVSNKLERVAQSLKIPFIDLLPAIETLEPHSLWVSPTDAHPNQHATEAFAAALESALLTAYPDILLH